MLTWLLVPVSRSVVDDWVRLRDRGAFVQNPEQLPGHDVLGLHSRVELQVHGRQVHLKFLGYDEWGDEPLSRCQQVTIGVNLDVLPDYAPDPPEASLAMFTQPEHE